MREIKFRGRDKYKHWHYGGVYINDNAKYVAILKNRWTNIEVDYKSVGQFTGLKDCKGQEIFEGDVVEFNDSWHDINGNYCEKMQRGYIKYDYGEFAIVTLRGEAFLRLLSTCVQSDTLMVIGNVYDSPELLEATE